MKKISEIARTIDDLMDSKALVVPEIANPLTEPPDLNDPAYDYTERVLFLEAVGRTESFRDAMAQVKGPKARRFLEMLISVEHKTRSVSWIAKKCGLDSIELADVWRQYNFQKAFTVLMEKLPEITEDVIADSRSGVSACPRCDSSGTIKVEKMVHGKPIIYDLTCPVCKGERVVRKVGSSADRERVWKAVGWSKPGSINVQVNNNGTGDVLRDVERMDPEALDAEYEEVE